VLRAAGVGTGPGPQPSGLRGALAAGDGGTPQRNGSPEPSVWEGWSDAVRSPTRREAAGCARPGAGRGGLGLAGYAVAGGDRPAADAPAGDPGLTRHPRRHGPGGPAGSGASGPGDARGGAPGPL